jgi:hypothetical protein
MKKNRRKKKKKKKKKHLHIAHFSKIYFPTIKHNENILCPS